MRRIILMLLCLLLGGCATMPLHPVGKTYNDWVLDETYCRISSGKRTGFSGWSPEGLYINLSGANEKYDRCLKEKGWIQ
jgi:hypothetical protein